MDGISNRLMTFSQTRPSPDPTKGMTCHCQHMSIIGSSLVAVNAKTESFLKIDLFGNLDDNILIPYVVMASLILFIILFVIALYIDICNARRPKVIVMGDVRRIRTDTFYFVTVETGNDWFGGTNAKVLCQIFGDNSHTKVQIQT